MDGWVIGIVKDTVDNSIEMTSHHPTTPLEQGNPEFVRINEELRLLKETLHRYLQAAYYHRTHSFFSA